MDCVGFLFRISSKSCSFQQNASLLYLDEILEGFESWSLFALWKSVSAFLFHFNTVVSALFWILILLTQFDLQIPKHNFAHPPTMKRICLTHTCTGMRSSAAQREKWRILYYLHSAAASACCINTLLSNSCFLLLHCVTQTLDLCYVLRALCELGLTSFDVDTYSKFSLNPFKGEITMVRCVCVWGGCSLSLRTDQAHLLFCISHQVFAEPVHGRDHGSRLRHAGRPALSRLRDSPGGSCLLLCGPLKYSRSGLHFISISTRNLKSISYLMERPSNNTSFRIMKVFSHYGSQCLLSFSTLIQWSLLYSNQYTFSVPLELCRRWQRKMGVLFVLRRGVGVGLRNKKIRIAWGWL